MGKKRKRPGKDSSSRDSLSQPHAETTAGFRNKRTVGTGNTAPGHSHPVISLYYGRVVTLRQYLLLQIPVSSRSRRKRIVSIGRGCSADEGQHHQQELAGFLDTTLVGILKDTPPTVSRERQRGLVAFTQSQAASQINSTDTGPACAQAEILDYVISALFDSNPFSYQKPQHLLAQGFQKAFGTNTPQCMPGVVLRYVNQNVLALKQSPWTDVLGLLGSNGDQIMMRLLLDCGVFKAIDYKKGIYEQVSGLPLVALEPVQKLPTEGSGPAGKTPPAENNTAAPVVAGEPARRVDKKTHPPKEGVQRPNSIVFFRRRMLYARPALTSKGAIQFGLSKYHVLEKYSSSGSLSQTVHIMKYLFPKQFGLHNVLVTTPNSREMALPFKDYSSREDEIALVEKQRRQRQSGNQANQQEESTKIPKRLRGQAAELVRQLQNRHKRCSYLELLKHYCPKEGLGPWTFSAPHSQGSSSLDRSSSGTEKLVTQARVRNPTAEGVSSETQGSSNIGPSVPKPKLSLTDYSTPASSVSAFCRAVLRKLIPPGFFGTGQQGESNRNVVFTQVDRFVRMRRFESLSLRQVCEGIKIASIPWLQPPSVHNQETSQPKLSLSDLQKRTELLHEFIYYIFDSILIPLIRANFYVTESQTHRNRLFYFRHDVWRQLTEQPMANLKSSMFEELKPDKAERLLGSRSLGYGSLRLLPKSAGIRPILNLKRRMLMKSTRPGKSYYYLGASINSTIAPIQSMLNYEKARNTAQLGSSLLSIGEIHSRLKEFKEDLQQRGRIGVDYAPQARLYFVKLDIQSCFDTIPQQRLVRLIEKVVSAETYQLTKYAEMRPLHEFGSMWPQRESETRQGAAARKFPSRAAPTTKPESLTDAATVTATRRRNTVFMDNLMQKDHNAEDLLDLLDEHVRNNVVKFGKKFFRQRKGIPQGSVLSSLLCNLFYAEMEREVLGFLQNKETLLLRLVDDFLLVTTQPDLANRFLHAMISGQPDYGISVNPDKSLVNFSASVNGKHIPRLLDTTLFPYCGSLIDTRTLEIHKDQDRILDGGDSVAATLSNSLTVESSRSPGRALHRKVLSGFKLQMHPMYLDTQHNSLFAVLSNIYANFVTAAMKMYRHMRSLPARHHPAPGVVVRTIRDLTQLAYRLVQARRDPGPRVVDADADADADAVQTTPPCTIQHMQVQYLAAAAFRFVLGRKQTRYGAELRWLDGVMRGVRAKPDGRAIRLAQVVRKGNAMYGNWRF